MDKLRLAALLLAVSFESAFGEEQLPQRTVITANDLNRRFQVYGSLGVPLGTVVTIVGEVEHDLLHKAYGSPRFLLVTSVSGRPITPVTLPYELSSDNRYPLAAKTKYELRVYEHGGFAGSPNDDMRTGPPSQELGYAFYSHLVVLPPAADKNRSADLATQNARRQLAGGEMAEFQGKWKVASAFFQMDGPITYTFDNDSLVIESRHLGKDSNPGDPPTSVSVERYRCRLNGGVAKQIILASMNDDGTADRQYTYEFQNGRLWLWSGTGSFDKIGLDPIE